MKNSYLALVAIVLGISLNAAYGLDDSISVNVDKRNYSDGETIHVSGTIEKTFFGHEITLMVFDPGNDIISIEKLGVDSDNQFQLTLKTNNLKDSGIYTVLAMYGPETTNAETTFSYEKSIIKPLQKKNTLLNFDFINPKTNKIQEHVDYKITITQNNEIVYGPTPLSHSSTGTVSIPISLVERYPHDIQIEVSEVLFQPIPTEHSSFSIVYGSKTIQSEFTSKNTLKVNLALNKDPSPEPKIVPSWVKNNAKWWSEGKINDAAFVQGIKNLMERKILDIPDLPYSASWQDKSVPSWVKNNASWWADNLIEEDDFIKGIKFLVEKGVITLDQA